VSLFDGIAGVLTGVFGAPVLYTPAEGVPITVEARFRSQPIEVPDTDGNTVIILSPTLRVSRTVLPDIARGDLVQPEGEHGPIYRVLNRLPSGSPADDAFIVCELEEAEP